MQTVLNRLWYKSTRQSQQKAQVRISCTASCTAVSRAVVASGPSACLGKRLVRVLDVLTVWVFLGMVVLSCYEVLR